MKKELGILLVFVALLAGAMLFSGCGRKTSEEEMIMSPITPPATSQVDERALPVVSKPWVQISKGGLFLVTPATSTTGTVKIALKTGDELNEGDQIETDKTGLTNIYFPDGSVARLDTETKITITSALYVPNSKTLVVRLKLAAGSVWSKIMKLATPESVWEVNSTNAVAAVRGSAFGMSLRGGNIRVIGSEHKIIINLLDAKTGFLLKGQEASVAENDYLDITPDELAAFIKGEKKISDDIEKIPAAVLNEGWIKYSLAADKKINDRLLELEGEGLSSDQALDKYRAETIEKFYPATKVEPTNNLDGEIVTSTISDVTTTPNEPASAMPNEPASTTPDSTATSTTTTVQLDTASLGIIKVPTTFYPKVVTQTPVTSGR